MEKELINKLDDMVSVCDSRRTCRALNNECPYYNDCIVLEHRFECKITDLCSIVNYVKEKENASTN
ncbi:hypothetical protein FYJ53_05885 [Eubacterium sp. BL-380-WT-2B]|uniref:hypothetical protein n=1 Tax=Eubacterium TaxID=1730 RepID=UPI0012B31EDE|nr:hypothetical protein [Eubacterium sp. BL-380-WT-2B]MSS93293.1 hypothetical protein [Eubacterium sp. BL-380-WT-2B]